VKSYRFEIVRRKRGRYGWRVVAIDGARRRELARSPRTYRSLKRANRAIEALRCADVVDMTRGRDLDGISLPATAFGFVPGVVPLLVTEHPDYARAAGRGDEGAERKQGSASAAARAKQRK
jgi:hypothetical protein